MAVSCFCPSTSTTNKTTPKNPTVSSSKHRNYRVIAKPNIPTCLCIFDFLKNCKLKMQN